MSSENDQVSSETTPVPETAVPAAPGDATSAYGAEQIEALKGLEGIRRRPAMYIGGTDSRGLNHLVFEVVDNSIDEFVAGHGTLISVHINVDGSITCSDDGRG